MAETYLIFEGPGAEPGAWDKFRIRTLALAAQRAGGNPKLSPLAQVLEMIPGRAGWTAEEKRAAVRILRAKRVGEESRYLREMQRHGALRAAIIRAGQTAVKNVGRDADVATWRSQRRQLLEPQ
jgi:hypothetical protein